MLLFPNELGSGTCDNIEKKHWLWKTTTECCDSVKY